MAATYSHLLQISQTKIAAFSIASICATVLGIGACDVSVSQPAPVQPKWQMVGINTRMQYFYDANYVRPIGNGKVFITRGVSDQSNDKIVYLMLTCNSNKYAQSLNEDFSNGRLQVMAPNTFTESIRDDVCQHGAVHRNLQNLIMMQKINTYGQFYNGLIQHAAGGP